MAYQSPYVYPTAHLSFLSDHVCITHLPPRHFDPVHILLEENESHIPHTLPPIFSALKVLEKCPLLRALLATFPPSIHYAVKASLLTSDPYQDLRLQVLETLLWKKNALSTVVGKADPVPLSFLLQHECVFYLLEGMLVEPAKYRRELAFLFTQLSLPQLPQRLQKIAISSVTPSLTVLPMYSDWFLCSLAEDRLLKAMHDHATLLVNGVILLKFNGKLSGLALQTTVLADGTQILEGCWYAPIDHRAELRDAFDRGESRVCMDGEWTLIRELDESDDNTLLQRAQAYAAALPEQLPQKIGNTTRQTYRHDTYEGF